MLSNILLTLFACACIGAIVCSIIGYYAFAAPVAGGLIGAGAGVAACLLRNLGNGR